MGRDSIWLAYCGSVTDIGPKNTHVNTGTLFIGLGYQNGIPVMTYVVSSHCIHNLPEVRDDMFYIIAQAMPVCRNIKRCSLACIHKTMPFMGA